MMARRCRHEELAIEMHGSLVRMVTNIPTVMQSVRQAGRPDESKLGTVVWVRPGILQAGWEATRPLWLVLGGFDDSAEDDETMS
ncbi:hypothetical protein LMH87_009297 [Akanthomyces muscarius]|uniref:Uncharacterized protein n=1 Tax=Akanthomyces muscarius TaxID=2231603 RepID=A0A9W8QBR2_AKAMU|nr:hypothetical protein LMH87_009297 [Akanthomyces muscarius]KAJ4152777.1 hypothetical protein LMH87_009297 [Akanthomyces muscarius]